MIVDVTLQGRLIASSYTCKTFLCFITEIERRCIVTDLDRRQAPPRGGPVPRPPPSPGALRGLEGEGNRRDGKGNGDGREDGALGSWGLPGGPWDSCGSPGVPQRPLGALRGPPRGPGDPWTGAWASRRAGGPERRGARSSLTPPGPGAISLTTLEGPQGS